MVLLIVVPLSTLLFVAYNTIWRIPSLKEMWVFALTNGQYKQGLGALRDSRDRYCCLGVLCDLPPLRNKIKWRFYPEEGVYEAIDIRKGLTSISNIPTDSLIAELGLTREITHKLMVMNDGEDGSVKEHSFKEIAEYIDNNVQLNNI